MGKQGPKRKPIEYVIDENGGHICTSHPSGYTKVNGKMVHVHRIIYREHFGEPDEDKRIYRVCGNKRCINPEHLKEMTSSEHVQIPIEYVIDENGCHICTSPPGGHKKVNGKRMHVHHYVYRTKVGEIPEGMIVIRSCKNTKCINPDHLTLSTRKEAGATRMVRPIEFDVDPVTGCFNCTSHPVNIHGYPSIVANKKRYLVHRLTAKGSRHRSAKLTEEDVRVIRKKLDAGESLSYLAMELMLQLSAILKTEKHGNTLTKQAPKRVFF